MTIGDLAEKSSIIISAQRLTYHGHGRQ